MGAAFHFNQPCGKNKKKIQQNPCLGNMDSIANNTKQLFTFYWWDQMYRITEIFDRYYICFSQDIILIL